MLENVFILLNVFAWGFNMLELGEHLKVPQNAKKLVSGVKSLPWSINLKHSFI